MRERGRKGEREGGCDEGTNGRREGEGMGERRGESGKMGARE